MRAFSIAALLVAILLVVSGLKESHASFTSAGTMTVNSEGRGDVVQHAHPGQGTLFLYLNNVTDSTAVIMCDISNTTDFPHALTEYVHIEYIDVQVDGNNQATYHLEFGFLENVGASDSDFIEFFDISGSKTAGTSVREFFNPYPNGMRLQSKFIATSEIEVDNPEFGSSQSLPDLLDPDTADVNPAAGDFILDVTMSAGEANISITISYHTH